MASDRVVFLLAAFLAVVSGNHLTNRVFKWTHNQPTDYISQGKSLEGRWFYASTKKDVLVCAYGCLRLDKCLSFNYNTTSGKCTFNYRDHTTDPLTNAAGQDLYYHAKNEFSIDPEALGPCAGDVCNSNGRCLETKTSDDQLIAVCVCKNGWGGDTCATPAAAPTWAAWQAWDDCSVSCERGYRLRTRNCEDTTNGQTLNSLECEGRHIEYEACQMPACPRWEDWGSWGKCTTYKTCGRGFKTRQRTCGNGGTPGVDRYCLGLTNQTTFCESMDCMGLIRLKGGSVYGEGRVEIFNDVARQWGMICGDQWSHHAADLVCKQLGKPGAHAHTTDARFGLGDGNYVVTSLTCTGNEKTVRMCERNPWSTATSCNAPTNPAGVQCKVNGVWALWSEWGDCSVTCEDGIRQRTRTCSHPPALHGGRDCVGEDLQTKPCTLDMCPVDGVWRSWGAWSECSTSCGPGSQWRSRECEGPFYDGQDCQGESRQTQDCQVRMCPVDGVWNGWETWADCTEICGGGVRSRTRTCHGPFYDGAICPGDAGQTEDCNMFECPVDGAWLPWHEWRDCTVTCGGGNQIRKRDCLKPKHGGSNCEGPSQEKRECETQECPVDGTWRPWGAWGVCNVTCGGGSQKRVRMCKNSLNGGQDCAGTAEDFQDCNMHACPANATKVVLVGGKEVVMVAVDGEWVPLVDGVWRVWNEWSACSHRCGTGTQTRNRTCDGPYFGGKDCEGSSMDVLNCNTHSCAVDGIWEAWTVWSTCTVSCGGSTSRRSRSCDGPYFGGKNCSGLWTEERPCGTAPCPIDGVWKPWSDWSACSVTCGGSISKRSRTCDGPLYGGRNCTGSWDEERPCGTDDCPIDGVWRQWSDWSDCPVTCGGSIKNRSRTCDGPYFGGANCSEPWTEVIPCGTTSCPIDGEWKLWSTWETCNVTCGGGSQSRSRQCQQPEHGGETCGGEATQTRGCNDNPCPVDGVFQTWEAWGPCSLSCGGGGKWRYRNCTGPFHGGHDCSGSWEDQSDCNTSPCPEDGVWLAWGSYTECDLSCGGGMRSRQRKCDGPRFGGADCPGSNEEQVTCNDHNCPVDGDWLNWTGWEDCSVTCGGGTQWRDRVCNGPFWGGQECPGSDKESRDCNTHNCPEDGYFDNWSDWDSCDVTCGGGIRWRERTCIGPFFGGADCEGARNESEACNTHNCPVDGVYSDWTDWGACTESCGGGMKYRTRTCRGPFYGGAECEGRNEESTPCNEHNCPVDGTWQTWQPWGTCTVSCGGGIQKRLRACVEPLHGGLQCEGAQSATQECSAHACPVDGIWAEWAKWSTCTLSCGGGKQWRNRNCLGPFDGGKECQGQRNTTQDCNTQNCPIDGVYDDWSEWGTCSDTCGGGTQTRTRTCITPKYGGLDCQGLAVDTLACNSHPCPVDGVYQTWGDWGPCNTTCGGGYMKRVRICDEPKYGGKDCVGDSEDLKSCSPNPCPIPGDWATWAVWSECSVTCGGGKKSRSRVCDMTSHGELTAPCEGPEDETIDCHTFSCTPLARTCSEWGEKGLSANTMADIDPDEGEGPLSPVRVYCDMQSEDGIGITVIGHEAEEEQEVVGYEGAGEYILEIMYNVSLDHAIAVVDASANCRQFIQWRCKAAVIHNPNGDGIITTGWRNRTGDITDYFGEAPRGSGMCTCGVTMECADDETLACNCDKNDDAWREDSGYLSHKEDLPVTEFLAGDTGGMNEGGYRTIGPLTCSGLV